MTPPPLILVCDHRGAGLLESLAALAPIGWRIERSARVRETRAALKRAEPALIVIDPLVEGGRAELEEILATLGPEACVPFLLVFDGARPESAVSTCTELPVAILDLVQRGARPEELRVRVERLLAQSAARGELDELRHQALHDDRTDLLRPRAFQHRLVEHYSAAERHRLDLALVLVDLDGFGAVNKRFDHTVGDRIIARVGDAIRATLRTEDVAGRLGGDEFAVLLPYTKRVDAARVTKRLCDRIRALSGRFAGADDDIQVSASLGFETFDGEDVDGIETFRSHAEIALRAAKSGGGDRGIYYRALERQGTR